MIEAQVFSLVKNVMKKHKMTIIGVSKGPTLWSLPGKVGGLGEGKTTHRKRPVFLPPKVWKLVSKTVNWCWDSATTIDKISTSKV